MKKYYPETERKEEKVTREERLEGISKRMASITNQKEEIKDLVNTLDVDKDYERIYALRSLMSDLDGKFDELLDTYIEIQSETL